MAITPPSKCLETNPKAQSILFAGRFINLRSIARTQAIDHSYLSRIFNGQRGMPRVVHGKKIAAALGMSYADFLDALEERHKLIHDHAMRALTEHQARIEREDNANLHRVKTGRAPRPPMPGTR